MSDSIHRKRKAAEAAEIDGEMASQQEKLDKVKQAIEKLKVVSHLANGAPPQILARLNSTITNLIGQETLLVASIEKLGSRKSLLPLEEALDEADEVLKGLKEHNSFNDD